MFKNRYDKQWENLYIKNILIYKQEVRGRKPILLDWIKFKEIETLHP